MLQRLGIRGKLLAVVAVPTIVLLLAATFVVFDAANSYSAGRNTTQLVQAVESGTPLVAAVQAERAEESHYLRAINDGDADRISARNSVNTTVATLRAAGEEDPSFAPIADAIVAAIDGADFRQGLDTARGIATVDHAEGEFPDWPLEAAVESAIEEYLRIADEVADAATAAPVNEFGTLARSLPSLIRFEASATQDYLNDARNSAEALPATASATDKAADLFLADAGRIANSELNAPVLVFIESARTRLEGLDDIRAQTRAGTIQPGPAVDTYTNIVSDLLDATREVANTTTDRTLATYLNGFVAMGELLESMRQEEVYVTLKIAQGFWRLGEIVQFQAYYFGTNNALENAMAAVSPLEGITQVPEFGVSYSPVERNGFETIRDRLFTDPNDRALQDQRVPDWEEQVAEEVEVQAPILYELQGAVNDRATVLERDSLIQMLATAAVAVLAVVVSLLVAQLIARRIINPLRRLTTTATAVRQELPRLVERVALPGQTVDVSEVQIPVESQDEVGRLAEAFNSVNAATLSIAAEQAALRGSISEMFVNVARRDQVLLNRQLSSIDEMERTEDNQTTLTKLFALDHLATRMRRNSESLLVLAGIDTGRRLRRPMPLSDVIRTASSEIELYERVQLELDADPSMLGHSALTAAHLFAELLENATVFSDPGTPVVVKTMTDGDDVVVEVIDYGIGMTPEELAEANARVASTAASEILGAQRLGLFVVGRIARRVGARVQLESLEAGGICARVVMPRSLFDATATYEEGHHSSTATDESTHAPAALVHHSVADSEERDPVPEPASRAISSTHGYQPTVIEDGTGLAGRAVDSPDAESASSEGLDGLVAADAASAPEAVPVDLDALTDGATPAGLPTRRRRNARAGAEAPQETNSIIGLPMRASDEQLTALESAATSGFTPILAANEVSPESAEQRARVFRGFRPLRGDEGDTPLLPPDAESLGHAVRRGAPEVDLVGQSPEPTPVPALEPDETEEAAAGADQQGDASEPESPFAVEPADPRHTESPVVRQSPLIATGFTGEDEEAASQYPTAPGEVSSMAIPVLEEDDTDVAGEGPWGRPSDAPSAGVESVSLDDEYAEQPSTAEPPAPAREPMFRSPLYPTASSDGSPYAAPTQAPEADSSGQWQQGEQGQEPQFESDPVTSTPSLDDLIMDSARPSDSDDRGGFFSRVFGRGHKHEEQVEAAVQAPAQYEAPAQPEFVAPQHEDVDFPPPPDHTPAAPVAPPSGEFAAPAQELTPQPVDDASGWIGQAPPDSFGQPEAPAPGFDPRQQEQALDAAPAGFMPDPTRNEDVEAEWSYAGNPQAAVPEPTAEVAEPTVEAPEPTADDPSAHPGAIFYSPDQLANPLGWEAAGESALQAAAPESATEYRPVVQLEEQLAEGAPADFASEVFSELSSLAKERPKVEKTRAGLVKRTPVEREAEAIPSADVAAPEVPRDAEAVRNRFSSFYSGTQRARDDVKNFNDSTQGSLTES